MERASLTVDPGENIELRGVDGLNLDDIVWTPWIQLCLKSVNPWVFQLHKPAALASYDYLKWVSVICN